MHRGAGFRLSPRGGGPASAMRRDAYQRMRTYNGPSLGSKSAIAREAVRPVSRTSGHAEFRKDIPWDRLGYCWVGGARYSAPLDPTADRKWRALESLQIRMHVIAFSDDILPHSFTQHARFHLLPRWGVPVLRQLTLLVGGTLLTVGLVLRGDAHVVIAQSPFEGFIGAIAKRIGHMFRRRAILIVESHGDFEWVPASADRAKPLGMYRKLLRWAARSGLKHADLLRAVSMSTRRQLEATAPGRPIVVFPAWLDAEVFEAAPREALERNCQDLLFAGVLAPVKGIEVLLDAFARVVDRHPQARVTIAGRPESARYLRHLKQRAGELGLADRVVFEGEVPAPQLAHLMGRARGLVLPSYSEGLSRVLIEGMLRGTPAISSRVGGIPEIIHDGENGYLVPPGDAQRLAEAIAKLFADPDIEAMGQRARASAKRLLSTAPFIDGYRSLLVQAHALWAAG